jgi:hypothetical protein
MVTLDLFHNTNNAMPYRAAKEGLSTIAGPRRRTLQVLAAVAISSKGPERYRPGGRAADHQGQETSARRRAECCRRSRPNSSRVEPTL